MASFNLSAVSSIPSIPSYAAAFGITNTLFFDGMDNLSSFDVNNTLVNGYNWYVNQVPRYQGVASAPGTHPVPPNYYTVSNSILTMLNNNGGGFEFTSRGFTDDDPINIVGNSIPLIPGSRPFYIEWLAQLDPTHAGVHPSALWLEDVEGIRRSVNNTASDSTPRSEIDIFENIDAVHAQLSVHLWTGPSTITPDAQNMTAGWDTSAYHRWGCLAVPRSFNGGTGFVRFYFDRAPSPGVSDVTWSGSDAKAVEAANYVTMMATDTTPLTSKVDYVWCAVNP